jgi:sugar phosphate isomerase/epimerase
VLADSGHGARHANALAAVLATTGLKPTIHAPSGLRVGTRHADRAADGLLACAAQVGASHVVYHARALPDAPDSEDALLVEARARATRAERLGVTRAFGELVGTLDEAAVSV